MTLYSGLFNSKNGDRKYDAVWLARYFSRFVGNGVFANPSTGLQVTSVGGMQLSVLAGDGWINGYYLYNDSSYLLQISPADGSLNRIDRVVMRLDYADRQIKLEVKKGAPSANPTPPALQRDINAYELSLANILVNRGVITVTQAYITDTRLDSTVCGVVTSIIDQVDTTAIFNQYLTWLAEQKTDYEANYVNWRNGTNSDYQNWLNTRRTNFDTWFATLQNTLSGNVAANLQNQIQNTVNVTNAIYGLKSVGKNLIKNGKGDTLTGWARTNSTSIKTITGFEAINLRVLTAGTNRTFINLQPTSFNIDTLESGKQYTISCWMYISSEIPLSANNNTFFVRGLTVDNQSAYYDYNIDFSNHPKDQWFKLTHTFTARPNNLLVRQMSIGVSTGDISVREIMFEEGPVASPWTASAEEIYERLNVLEFLAPKTINALTISNTVINVDYSPLHYVDRYVTSATLASERLSVFREIRQVSVTGITGVTGFIAEVNTRVLHYANSGTAVHIIQEANVSEPGNKLYRYSINDTTWGPWKMISTMDDINNKLKAQATDPTSAIPAGRFVGVYT